VQEALLALPYAYSRLEVHGRAALLYGRAVETLGSELAKLDASIASVREGAFLAALVREEIRQDKDWVIRLRSLPDAPETFYLTALMASHDFQTALQNYLDLEDMRRKLGAWQTSLDSFDDLVRIRQEYYEPLLPEIDGQFRKLDAQMRLRLEQRKHVKQRLEHLLIAPRPEYLATADEQSLAARIARLEGALGDPADPERAKPADPKAAEPADPDAAELRPRIRRLAGVLTFRQAAEYHQRLTDAHAHLRELETDVAALTSRYEAFVRARQAATHSYVGYGDRIDGLRARIADAQGGLEPLMARQGHVLEAVASRELGIRRERLEAYQNQARFAFADSYDRAAKAQAQ
jgi:chromosome segregation ATPase